MMVKCYKKEYYGKVLVFCILFIHVWRNTQGATKSINVFNTQTPNQNIDVSSQQNYANNKIVKSVKTYTTKAQRSIDNFNTRPELVTKKIPTEPIYPPLFTSYDPPPSGFIAHKEMNEPLDNIMKHLLPQSIKSNDFAKHSDFIVSPSLSEEKEIKNPAFMLMTTESTTVPMQSQFHKTIKAANVLASTLLDVPKLSFSPNKESSNPMNIFIVKALRNTYIIPTDLRKEAAKPSAVGELHPLYDQFEKAYTINQFIFVTKPENLNFLNKLV